MSLLGFDTSTAASSACVMRSDGAAFELTPAPERLSRPPAHASELMPAVAQVMERAGLGWDDLEAIAVGVGPGAFTGLRIGVTTARALAHAAGLPLRPVSSLAALAAGIDADERLAVIDAKRGELFGLLEGPAGPVWEPEATSAGITVAPDEEGAHVVRGIHVCRLAQSVADEPPETVLPDYLRAPDAKPQ